MHSQYYTLGIHNVSEWLYSYIMEVVDDFTKEMEADISKKRLREGNRNILGLNGHKLGEH